MGSGLMDCTRGFQRVYMQPVEGSYRSGSIRHSSERRRIHIYFVSVRTIVVVVCVYYKYKYCKWWTLGAPV
jgi:hypothetical protein